MKTPTEMLISALENDMDDIDKVLIIRIHKSRGISFEVNTGCRMDVVCAGKRRFSLYPGRRD
jgi:hypothetical protein